MRNVINVICIIDTINAMECIRNKIRRLNEMKIITDSIRDLDNWVIR